MNLSGWPVTFHNYNKNERLGRFFQVNYIEPNLYQLIKFRRISNETAYLLNNWNYEKKVWAPESQFLINAKKYPGKMRYLFFLSKQLAGARF